MGKRIVADKTLLLGKDSSRENLVIRAENLANGEKDSSRENLVNGEEDISR